MPQVLRDVVLNPSGLRDFIGRLSELSLKMAIAQIEAGADAITWADHATPDTVSRKVYEEFLLPIHKVAARKLTPLVPLFFIFVAMWRIEWILFPSRGSQLFILNQETI